MKRTFIGILLLVMSFSGCAATRRATIKNRSGFLGTHYRLLQEGGEDQAQLVYFKPSAPYKNYQRVWLAPVRIIRSKSSNLAKYSDADIQKIANFTYSTFLKELQSHWQLVNGPYPNTVKIELAVTDVDKSEPGLDTFSSVVPQLRTSSVLVGAVSGKPLFVGEASGEGKVTDAITGELLSAAVDRHVGTKDFSGMTNSWNDFEQAVEYWAKRFTYNLCLKKGNKNCGIAPRA